VTGARVVDFRVLGPVEVIRDGVSVVLGPKPRAVLAYLVLNAGLPVSATRISEELWGDDPPPTARSSLHVHLSKLRKALASRLRTTPAGYVLEAEPAEVDALRFEQAVEVVRRRDDDTGTTSDALRAALAMWRGPAFEGIDQGPAIMAAAARLEELRLTAAEDWVDADLALGRHEQLVAELQGMVETHPTRERLAGQLMLALHRSHRSADALRVYDQLCSSLDETLGVDPGDDMSALARAIRRGDPTLVRPGSAGLPLPTTSFVGRGDELAELKNLLGRERLMTLVGPGGSGKSRLALELARVAAPDHPGGVFLVGLGGLAPADSVTRAVAGTIDARERPGEPLLPTIVERFRHGSALLLLDDCDHLAAQCAGLCGTLLEVVPGLRILATSREPLGVSGEMVYRVQGLGLPASDARPAEQLRCDAVRLLAERMAAARPGVDLQEGDATDAAAVCSHLDGLPLAIELVAARVRSMSLHELADHVGHHLDLVGGGRRAGHERHRTMRAAIDWSHQLLDEPERVLFRRLAVFASGFGSVAAEALAAIDPPTGRAVTILAQLVDRSLVEVTLRPGEAARYRLLEVVRQYAAWCLVEAGEEAAVRAAHAAWFAELASGAAGWGGDQQQAWVHRVERDLDNLRAALGWFLGDGWAPEKAIQMLVDMWWVWYVRGMPGESWAWLRRALAAAPTEPTPARAKALLAAAACARGTGGFAEAAELGAQALDIQLALGDEWGQAAALNSLCISATALGDLDAALEHAEASLSKIESLGVPRHIATSRLNLGVVLRARGDLQRPEELFESARRAYDELGDSRGCAAALSDLALLAHRRGEAERAWRFALDALAIYEHLGFIEGQVDCLEFMACHLAARNRPASAVELLTVTDRVREKLGAPLFVPDWREARAAAVASIREALSNGEVARVADQAARLELQDVVRSILAESQPHSALSTSGRIREGLHSSSRRP
jgi:predicted ATPase/DNA-binding SARP family transcriptional activator